MSRHSLSVHGLVAGYGDRTILHGLDLDVLPGRITAIVGANACGKSTLLRSMSRLLTPRAGQVLLDGKAIHKMPPRRVAQVMGLLPQSPTAPEGITVADLVSRGRHPHHGILSRWSPADDAAVAAALEFDDPADEQAVELQTLLRSEDASGFTVRTTGLDPEHPLFRAVRDAVALRQAAVAG